MIKASDDNFIERRQGVRAQRIITVRHRLVKRKRKSVNEMWNLSTTEDMSISGLLFKSAIKYELKDVIELQVIMSGVLDIFNGYGEVVRVNKKDKGIFFVAVKYVDLKRKKRSAKALAPKAKKAPAKRVAKKAVKKTVKKKKS